MIVPGIPFELSTSEDWPWKVTADGVSTTAKPHSDIFTDPQGGDPSVNAVTLLGAPPAGDFTLAARVEVDFAGDFDAGVLLLWADETHWAKLCFEFSPDAEPMVVTVVSRGVSDDANGFVVDGRSVWLRISRIGGAYAFHASADGEGWAFVRLFQLPGELRLGFEAQSPMGDGCAVTFSDVAFTPVTLGHLRDGS